MKLNAADDPQESPNGAEELRQIAHRLLEIADLVDGSNVKFLAHLNVAQSRHISGRASFDDLYLSLVARSIYRLRRRRANWFPSGMFAEPAWDMLLDLFIHVSTGKLITTTSLCIAADVPATTALRWIGILESEGLVERFKVSGDSRISGVRMTDVGLQTMRGCLSEWLLSQNENSTLRRLFQR